MSNARRIIVLGHTGFIGTRLVGRLAQIEGIQVMGRAPGEVDLTDERCVDGLAELFDESTAVVMCSAVKRQFGDTLETYLQNVAMVANLCGALVRSPVAKVVYFSSAAVYGEDVHNTAITEDTPVNPRSYYGAAKFAGECILRKQLEGGKTSLVSLRPPLVYGPGDAGETYGPSGFVRKALRGEKVTLWGDGSELREFLFIDDIAEIVARLVMGAYSGTLNAVSGQSHSFREALDLVESATGVALYEGSRPRSKRSVDNAFINTRLREALPGLAFMGLEEGIRATIRAERERTKAD